jgi:hypothetical protein
MAKGGNADSRLACGFEDGFTGFGRDIDIVDFEGDDRHRLIRQKARGKRQEAKGKRGRMCSGISSGCDPDPSIVRAKNFSPLQAGTHRLG